MKQGLVLAAVFAAAAFSLPAKAQIWLSDRRLSEGIGIKVGELELHPGLGGEFGYDSNYFRRAPSESPAAAYRLRVTPSLSLSTIGLRRRAATEGGGMPRVMFRAGLFGSYNELIATESSHSDELSDQRHFTLGANARVDINRRRPIGVDLEALGERFVDPTGEGGLSNESLDSRALTRDVVRGGGGVTWRPGGGLFEWRLGYTGTYTYFEETDLRENNNVDHDVNTRGRWRFLPRTALLFNANYQMIRYTHSGALVPFDGDILSARVGLTGLVTPRIGVLGLVGWSSTFYDGGGQDDDTSVGHAEVKDDVQPPPQMMEGQVTASTGLSTIALGYSRDISNSYISSFFRRDRGYLSLVYFLAGTFVTELRGGYSYLTYGRGVQYDSFHQRRIDARLFAEYRVSDSFGINATLLFDKNMSGRPRPYSGQPVTDDLDFTRYQAYIGARWFL